MDKILTAALVNRNQIPAFSVELGGPKIIDERFVRIGVNGIKNILKHFQMIEVKREKTGSSSSEIKIKTKERQEIKKKEQKENKSKKTNSQ